MKTKKRLLSILLTLALVLGLMPAMSMTAYADDGHTHNDITFSAWNSTDSLPTEAGNYYLTGDVTISSSWTVPSGTTNLCLNGHGIKTTGDVTVVSVIGSDKALNIYDEEGTNETHYYTLDSNGKAVVNDSGAHDYSFTGGYITGGNFAGNRGGGLVVAGGGSVVMTGGTIIGNHATWGAGVCVGLASQQSGGSFTLSGDAVIMRNFGSGSWGCGAAVAVTNGASFIMNGGIVKDNRYGNAEGNQNDGIYVGISNNNDTFEMTGGIITGHNTGVVVNNNNTVVHIGGSAQIKGNTEKNLYLANGKPIIVSAPLDNSAMIGVTMQTPGVFTNSSTTSNNDASKFSSDNESYVVGKNADGQLFLGTPINSVEVTDITAPVATEALDTEATTSTSNVSLGTVTWEPTTTPAAYATEYTATVIATAAEGYAFTDNATATVNGETATVTKNADGTLSISYKFSKTALTPVTITATDKEVVWSADGIAIPVEGMFNITEGAGAATYTVENGTGEGTFAEDKLTVTKCGTFIVKASTAATETYEASSETSATLTVKKIDSTVTAPAAKNGLVYNGQPQQLITAGEADGGEMQYALGTATEATEPYTTSIPTATAAGTYYVWYKVVGDDNHNDSEAACVTSIIRGAISQTVTFKVVNGAWDDDTTADKTVTLTGYEGDTLKLATNQIPAVGTKPNDTFKAGSWDVEPSTDTAITEATTYTYAYAQKNSISQTVTFKVVNGKWDDDGTTEKTVTLTGYEGDTLKLMADQIPAVGTKPDDTYKAGSWDVTPSTDTEITAATTYTYAYAQKNSISQTVTFKVVNGKWDDDGTAEKTVTLTGYEGDTLKLMADQIPAVGTKPNDTYKAGSWDVTPNTDTEITADTTYTYTYAQKDSISQAVTFKVVNGSWDDDGTAEKTVTLTGYEGDTLKLTADQIPAVGTKPNDTYKAGSWDVTPSTDTEITAATTYTYTYAAKEASVVTKAPEAKTLTYNNEQAQKLVTAGEAAGGEMQYALGTATEATQPYTTSIPTATDAGTYYVWYKVVGDTNHSDTTPDKVSVTVAKAEIEPAVSIEGWTYGEDAKTPSVTGNSGDGAVTYTYAEKGSTDFSETVPTAAGEYTVKATIAETANYKSGEATADFTIQKKSSGSSTPGGGSVTRYPVKAADAEGGTVKTSVEQAASGSKVTVTATPDEGYEVDEIKVTDKNGKEIAVKKNDDGTYSFTQPASDVTVTVTFKEAADESELEPETKTGYNTCSKDTDCPMNEFTDLDPNAWYHDGVHFCIENGMMNGVGDNKFDPDGTTSRGMIVTILYRLEGKPEITAENPFDDVEAGKWYTDAVIWAAENKIVDGYGGGKFGPNDDITREQLATILYRYAQYKGLDVSVGEDTNILSFGDTSEVSGWANAAMRWAVGSGIINGKDGNRLDPMGNAIRTEAAAMIQRFCENTAE